jgi:hypothetical protein
MKIVSQTRASTQASTSIQKQYSAFLRQWYFLGVFLLAVCSPLEYALAQSSVHIFTDVSAPHVVLPRDTQGIGIQGIGIQGIGTQSRNIQYLNINARSGNTTGFPYKNTTKLNADPDTAWFFNTQNCDDPVVDTIGIRLFIDFPTRRFISGRVDSVRILNVPATSTFRLLAPLSPTNITANSSVRILASFSSNQLGVSTATLRAYSVDSAGIAIPPQDFPIYTRRERRSFRLLATGYDFGILEPNTPATAIVPFILNAGTIPVQWELPNSFGDFQIVSTRPASMPSLSNPTGARTILLQPNDTITLTVRFPGTVAGQYISYATNPRDFVCDITAPTFSLEARTAQNPANITVTPSGSLITPIDFGLFECSNRNAPYKDTTLKIYNSGQVTLRVTGASFSLPDYQIISPPILSETSPLLVPFNQSRDVIVRYTPRLVNPPDRSAVLTILSNAQSGMPLGVTTVNVKALKDSIFLTVSTQDVDFGAVQRGSASPTRTITITNTGTLGKAWTAPISLGNGFVVESIIPPLTPAGGTSQAVVRFSSTAVAGQFSAIWNVPDDCLRLTPVTVRISVDKPRPGIGIVSPVAFGVLSCSSDTTLSITVRNTSNDGQDLIIQQFNVLGGSGNAGTSPFSLVSPPPVPLTVRSGTPQTLQIRFRPQRTGVLTDTLRFVSNADDAPIFNVVLQGGKDSVGFRLSRTSISFVNIFPNTSLTDTLTVRNVGTTPIAWGSSGRFALGGAFTVQSVSPQVTPAGGSSLVTVRFLGSAADASATGTFTDACNRNETFTVQASILPPRIAVTQSVRFAALTCETNSSATVTVRNTGGQDLILTNVSGAQQGMSISAVLPIRILGGRDTTLPVRFQPTTLGDANATFTYTSNAANDRMNATSSTLSGVKNVRDFELLDFSPAFMGSTRAQLFANFGKLPPNASGIATFRIRNTGNLPIDWVMPLSFGSDGVFTVESISPNPTAPGAIAQATVRYTGTPCGKTYVTQMLTNIIGNFGFTCNANSSIGATAETEPATARIRLDSVSGGIGDTVLLPIRLENARYLSEAGVKEFQFDLRFNKTIVYPLGAAKGQVKGNERVLPVKLTLPNPLPADGVLDRIPFRITLGNTTATQVFLDNANASGVCVNLDTASARASASRICIAGGTRLVEISTTTTVLVNAKPNPVTDVSIVDFSLLERGYTTLTLVNTMGQVVKRLLDTRMEPGVYSLEVEASSLPSGVYFYILQTPTERVTRRLEVVR